MVIMRFERKALYSPKLDKVLGAHIRSSWYKLLLDWFMRSEGDWEIHKHLKSLHEFLLDDKIIMVWRFWNKRRWKQFQKTLTYHTQTKFSHPKTRLAGDQRLHRSATLETEAKIFIDVYQVTPITKNLSILTIKNIFYYRKLFSHHRMKCLIIKSISWP